MLRVVRFDRNSQQDVQSQCNASFRWWKEMGLWMFGEVGGSRRGIWHTPFAAVFMSYVWAHAKRRCLCVIRWVRSIYIGCAGTHACMQDRPSVCCCRLFINIITCAKIETCACRCAWAAENVCQWKRGKSGINKKQITYRCYFICDLVNRSSFVQIRPVLCFTILRIWMCVVLYVYTVRSVSVGNCVHSTHTKNDVQQYATPIESNANIHERNKHSSAARFKYSLI